MKTWRLGALLFLCALVLIASAWAEESLTGVWQGTDEQTGAVLRLTLRGDGTYTGFKTDGQTVYEGRYTAENGVCSLAVAEDAHLADFKYLHTQDRLVLLTEKGQVYTFEKQDNLAPDEALLGTWGGVDGGMYAEITFLSSGEARVFVPYRDAAPFVTTYETAGGKLILRDESGKAAILSYLVASGDLTITYPDGKTIAMVKKSGMLERAPLQEENVQGAADSVLCGTWGIYQNGVYREITFSGDGSFASFIPQDGDGKSAGQYIAWNGIAVILLEGQLTIDSYQVVDNELWYTPALHVKQVYTRKNGPLSRTAQ